MSNAGKRTIVIDDSPAYLGFMEVLLHGEGFCVQAAQSIEAARELLLTTRPDLIISDVRMPGSGAFGVLDLVDADDKTRTIPLLFCTGAVQEIEDAAERLTRARTDVLFKPFDIDDLLARIARLLQAGGRH